MSEIPDKDPPFFFRRLYLGATDMDEVTVYLRRADGSLEIHMEQRREDLPPELLVQEPLDIVPITEDPLVIYGREIEPRTREDRDYAKRMRERGQIFSECYSVLCVEGEVGTHPLATVMEISKVEFELARARSWEA